MSGRGRGINNNPAWMTNRGGPAGEKDDFGRFRRGVENHGGNRLPTPSDPGYRGPPAHGDYHRGPPEDFGRGPPRGYHPYDNRRGGDARRPPARGPPNGRGPPPTRGGGGRPPPRSRNPQGIYFNSWEEERDWVEDRRRKRLARKSLWDKSPTADQAALDARAAAMTNFAATDFSGVDPNSNLPQQTRHARRLYVGNLPPNVTEDSLHKFFRDSIETALVQKLDEDPILSVYINQERRFCFLEFKSAEMTTACMALDGIDVFGRGKVKVKRPNDYNAALAPVSLALPELDVSKLGIISTSVPDGPNKIFIGGLHYHLTEDQVLELLGAFGKVKAFHLVKNDPDSEQSKGYCFVEYADPNVTQVAVMGLNGMDLGQGKILTARIANEKDNAMVAPLLAAQQHAPNMSGQYNVEELVDAAMGLRPMPTAPSLLGMPVIPLVPISIAPDPNLMSPLAIANRVLEQVGHIPLQQISQPHPIAVAPYGTTRVLVLQNMVTDQDLATDQDHQELAAEVREECSKYGTLLSMKIPRPHEDGIEASAVRKIFLEYATVEEACRARNELDGRSFGPNTVQTSFFSEQDYSIGSLK